MDVDEIAWAKPWSKITDERTRAALERELQKELAPEHQLFGRTVRAIGRRQDCDDALFLVDAGPQLAVVHLTWTSSTDVPPWPATRFFATSRDFIQQCLVPDHDDFVAGEDE